MCDVLRAGYVIAEAFDVRTLWAESVTGFWHENNEKVFFYFLREQLRSIKDRVGLFPLRYSDVKGER